MMHATSVIAELLVDHVEKLVSKMIYCLSSGK